MLPLHKVRFLGPKKNSKILIYLFNLFEEREFRELMLANRQIISRGKQVMLSFKESNLGKDKEEDTQDDTMFTFTVLDCQPLAQGLVSEKLTKIVVVPPLELGNRSNDGPDSKMLKDMEDTRTFIDIGYRSEAIPRSSSPEPLFMSSFILPEYKHFFQQHAREPLHTTKRHNKLSVGLMPEPIDNPQPSKSLFTSKSECHMSATSQQS